VEHSPPLTHEVLAHIRPPCDRVNQPTGLIPPSYNDHRRIVGTPCGLDENLWYRAVTSRRFPAL